MSHLFQKSSISSFAKLIHKSLNVRVFVSAKFVFEEFGLKNM